jgi:hypothetical protein
VLKVHIVFFIIFLLPHFCIIVKKKTFLINAQQESMPNSSSSDVFELEKTIVTSTQI